MKKEKEFNNVIVLFRQLGQYPGISSYLRLTAHRFVQIRGLLVIVGSRRHLYIQGNVSLELKLGNNIVE